MTVTLNGKKTDLPNNQSLLQLLSDHNFANKIGIAVAINNTVVPKNNWDKYEIVHNDHILIISATKGG